MEEIRKLKEKVGSHEADVKLHKKLLERTNQPQSFMMKDIERAEKELDFAKRKANQLDSQLKKLKIENEQLKGSKASINDDLQRLLAKRSDIEQLQTALMGIIRHSSSRKIDVDDLRMLLSDSMKGGNHASVGSEGLEGGATRLREITGARKGNTRSRSRSKGASFDGYKTAGSAATVKMDDASALPAWYKTLKKNITS